MSIDTMPPNMVLIKQMANMSAMLPFCFTEEVESEAVITSPVFMVSVSIIEQDYFFSNGHNLGAIFCIHYLPIALQGFYKKRDQWVLRWQVHLHNDCTCKIKRLSKLCREFLYQLHLLLLLFQSLAVLRFYHFHAP